MIVEAVHYMVYPPVNRTQIKPSESIKRIVRVTKTGRGRPDVIGVKNENSLVESNEVVPTSQTFQERSSNKTSRQEKLKRRRVEFRLALLTNEKKSLGILSLI